MFNFFKKRKINKNNISSNLDFLKKEDCYLFLSGVFEQNILDDDKLENYNELLIDIEVHDNYKDLIRYFLLPYKISSLKFTLNHEYYRDPFPSDIRHKHKHIAPSLRKIKEQPFEIALGYPSWFFAAFPDVSLWAMRGEGKELVLNKFRSLSEDEIIQNNSIRSEHLHEIIELYKSNTNKTLECMKYE